MRVYSMLYNEVCTLNEWVVCVCVCDYGVQLCVLAYQQTKQRKKKMKNGVKTTLQHDIIQHEHGQSFY